MEKQTNEIMPAKITRQTFYDLGIWLSREQNYNQDQLSRLQDENFYLAIVSLANQYWLIGPLANQLKKSKIWIDLPVQLQNYLIELEQIYFHRSIEIKQEAIAVCSMLVQSNFKVVVLKGAASLFNGVAEPISNRFMCDIDLLVEETEQSKCVELLKSAGYREDKEDFSIHANDHHHAPALINNKKVCYIELHHSPLIKTASKILSTDDVWQHAIPLSLNEHLQVHQLEPTHQVILSIAHSEVSNKGYEDKHIDLHQLLNLCTIITHFQTEINWQIVELHFKRIGKIQILSATLFSAYCLFNLVTPITNKNDKQAELHVKKCINLYIKKQANKFTFYRLKNVLTGYNKETILALYGELGLFPLLRGRMKHFKRHMQMIITPKYLKRLIQQSFNRE